MEPNGYTLGEIAVRVARRFGMTNEADRSQSGFPVDEQYKDQVMEAINMGLRSMIHAHDRWRWLRPHVSILLYPSGDGPLNLESDGARYRLPPGIEGSPIEGWTFTNATSNYTQIQTVDFDYIRRMYAASSSVTGTPLYAATAPLRDHHTAEEDDNDQTAWQLILYPTPSAADTIEARFRIHPPDLSDVDERSPAGAEHDVTLIAAAQLELALMDETKYAGVIGQYRETFRERLAQSIRIDEKNGPRKLGQVWSGKTLMDRDDFRRATYQGVSSVGGIDPNA